MLRRPQTRFKRSSPASSDVPYGVILRGLHCGSRTQLMRSSSELELSSRTCVAFMSQQPRSWLALVFTYARCMRSRALLRVLCYILIAAVLAILHIVRVCLCFRS